MKGLGLLKKLALPLLALLTLAVAIGWAQAEGTRASTEAAARVPAHGFGHPQHSSEPARSDKVGPGVAGALAGGSRISVIVSLASDMTPPGDAHQGADPHTLAASQARVLAAVPSSEFALAQQYTAVPALAGNATAAGVWALAAQPDVAHVALNRRVQANLEEAVPLINADDAHSLLGVTGAGVVAAVLDTGIDTDHPLLSDDLIYQECLLDSGGCPGGGTTGPSAEDGFGHGTHVSGIITSAGPPVGVAPDAKIEAFKVLDDSGYGSFANVLAAYDHIITSHPEVDLINMSLGDGGSYLPGSCEGDMPALTSAITTTRAMGITTFAAAGNNGSKSGIGYPACLSDIVSVGAVYDANVGPQTFGPCSDPTTAADQVVCFSQSNISLDLLAPGSIINSTVPGGGLGNHSGTSMASPMALGVAALLLDSEPSLTPDEVETRLTETGVPITDAANGIVTCRVDAYQAVINDGGPVCASSSPPPPPNDDFGAAFAVPEPLPYTNSEFTVGATNEAGEPSPCGSIASTVWYDFTPTSNETLVADTFGSSYDTVLAVYTGPSLGSLTSVGCNDQFFGNQSRIVFSATAGTTYHFQVGGYFGAAGNLTFNLSTLVAPSCPSSPDFSFSVPDAVGDDFGFDTPSHDITAVSAEGDASTLCLTVDFAGPVDPADAGTGQEVVGVIEFDTDQNAATGSSAFMNIFCATPSGMGVEASLSLFSVSGGFGSLNGTPVPVVFDTSSFTAIIPLALIGGDNAFNVGTVIGSLFEPTDCAPANGGCIESPAGAICPPDSDEDGVPDAGDNCPSAYNPGQEDNDGDGLGDACDSDDDNDGFDDATELLYGSDPLNSASIPESNVARPGSCANGLDDDLDGFIDGVDASCDSDHDGTPDKTDNCPLLYNPGQENSDGDSQGNACDPDDDNDGYTDVTETNFASDPLNPASVPEHELANPGSCSDGVDNDLDGFIDGADSGCQAPSCGALCWDWSDFNLFGTESLWHWETVASVTGMHGGMLAFNQGCTGPGVAGCTFSTGATVSGRATSPTFPPPGNALLTFKTARSTENACGIWDRTFALYSTNGGASYVPLDLLAGSITPGGQYLAADGEICGGSLTAQTVTVPLPPGATNIAFDFNSGDAFVNDFPGQFIDDVVVTPCPPEGCPTPTPTPTPTRTPSPTPTPTCPPGKVPVFAGCGTPTPTSTPGLPDPGLDFSLGIDVDGDTTDDCGTRPGEATKCNAAPGSTVRARVYLNSLPFAIAGTGYGGFELFLNYAGVASKNNADANPWPDCVFEALAPPAPDYVAWGCVIGLGAPSSMYTGLIGTADFNCTNGGNISLRHGPDITDLVDLDLTKYSEGSGSETLNVNCQGEPSPTATPTPTTPPPFPRMLQTPQLQNVFLQRQGAKIPPGRCNDSTDIGTLTEKISQPITSISPKGELQTLGAFEFEVRFDPAKVCVNLIPSAAWQALIASGNAICTVQDKDSSTLEGIARIGCVTVAKGHAPSSLELATISVRPQPELYSQIRPNQDNGVAVQILNQGCELADEQGHAIPIFSCEDADITFRYLEGDVDGPDCDVDVFDTQQVAFRWGATKGSLLYQAWSDLEPSGQVKGDGDIDINDLQFIYGRFDSTCSRPWPAQPPVNPKS